MDAAPIGVIIGPVAGLEAGAIAMTPVPQHFLESIDNIYEEYFSVREEFLILNASKALNPMIPIWDTNVEILQQTLKKLNEIRAAAMKTARELRTAINK